MADTAGPRPDQHFPADERLFRRVPAGNLLPTGKPSPLAFGLPDMSVNRERCGPATDAVKGFDRDEWAVVAFRVEDIPNRMRLTHGGQQGYVLIPRHVPVPGNFAHTEVRVFRETADALMLITERNNNDFADWDPDREGPRTNDLTELDPDFHLRWRKRIALACSPAVVRPPG